MNSNEHEEASRAEKIVMWTILVVVFLSAAAISLSHVRTFTIINSPDGTPGWYGWCNAIISELVPIAAGIRIKHNRKIGKSYRLPMALFVGGFGFSVVANVAVAVQTPGGWLASAYASVMLLGLGKVMLSDSGKKKSVPTSDQKTLPTSSLPIADQQPSDATPLPLPTPTVPEPVSVSPAPEPASDQKPSDSETVSKPRRKRQHTVPAHPERSDSGKRDVAEIVKRADQLKSELGTWEKVASEIGITARTLQKYRNGTAVAA